MTTANIRLFLQDALKETKSDILKKDIIKVCAELEEYENLVQASKVSDWAKQHDKVLKQKPKKKVKKAKPSSYDFMDLKSDVDDTEVERELSNLKQHIPS